MTYLTVNCTNKDPMEIANWCDTQFGSTNWSWQTQWPSKYWIFYLPNTKAETLFQLRWR